MLCRRACLHRVRLGVICIWTFGLHARPEGQTCPVKKVMVKDWNCIGRISTFAEEDDHLDLDTCRQSSLHPARVGPTGSACFTRGPNGARRASWQFGKAIYSAHWLGPRRSKGNNSWAGPFGRRLMNRGPRPQHPPQMPLGDPGTWNCSTMMAACAFITH